MPCPIDSPRHFADTFEPVSAASAVGMSDTPFLADLTGDGILDSVVLDGSGDILDRAGLPGASKIPSLRR